MEAIVNQLIRAIGWSILHSLWQGAIIYALLFVILMAWPKMSAKVKHNLAFGSLFLIFASFCFTFFSVFEWPSNAGVIKQIELNQLSYQHVAQLGNRFELKTEAYFPIVSSVYMVGIAFQLMILLSGYFKLKTLKKSSTLATPAEWSAIFETTLNQLKINKTVRFYLSAKVNVPLVIGFFKPVVLFPVALATQLDLKQVEAILIHELSHIRRNDYLINLVKTCIETLLFFNPFVWLTTKFILIEREHACDDLVVNFTGTPLTYAHALLKLEILKDKQKPALSLAATGTNQHLYQRIKRITDMKTNYINVKQQFFILTLTIATVVSLAWINPTKKSAEKAKKESSIIKVKGTPTEAKTLNGHLIARADTDSTTSKNKLRIVITDHKGKEKVYHSVDELPDSLKQKITYHQMYSDTAFAYLKSPEWKNQMARIQEQGAAMAKKFESKEWKDQMAKIQEQSVAIAKKFDSPEWKAHMAKIQEQGVAIAKKFDSPEWKAHMAKIQEQGEAMSKKFESKEWKDQMARMQEQGVAMAKKFDSPEWKAQMAKIQEQSVAIAKKFDSPEWKAQMARIQEQSEAIAKKFDSPEWKNKMAELEKNGEMLRKKYDSKEWKDKMEEFKKLQDSPEYKELRKKYESDLDELKKKKGIKSDKALLLFNADHAVGKLFLPYTALNSSAAFSAAPPFTYITPDVAPTAPATLPANQH
jgi:bla regulator protein BlaR1